MQPIGAPFRRSSGEQSHDRIDARSDPWDVSTEPKPGDFVDPGAQERKEQEARFKDLLKRQRYEEALSVARIVIQRYPQSPTATELNKLLPRVEEMARQEAARDVVSEALG